MNDRFLRNGIVGLGGKAHGVPREIRFDITAASEVMAIMALARDYEDLEARLARIVVGSTHQGKAVTAGDVGAASAMTAVLRDALKPNLVQTREGGPAIVHCGPFGNIAHGCNSVLATRLAIQLGDYAITEAGFGFDLGGEKFLDIKCREAGIWPRLVVIVATLRALKMHGGAPVKKRGEPDAERLEAGLAHLRKASRKRARVRPCPGRRDQRFSQRLRERARRWWKRPPPNSAPAWRSPKASRAGAKGRSISRKLVAELADATDAAPPKPRYIYELEDSAHDKIRKIARTIYGAQRRRAVPHRGEGSRAHHRRSATTSFPSAWPRRSFRSPITRPSSAGRATSSSLYAKFA